MDETDVIIPSMPTPEPLATPLPDEVIAAQAAAEKADAQIAALKDHPGYAKVKKQIEDKIAEYESVSSLVADGQDDAKIAQQARVNIQVARVLRSVLAEVDHHASAST